MSRSERRTALLAALCAGALACGTAADSVCEDIGDCRSQSSDQIHACQAEAKSLLAEAAASGCAQQAAAWFSCADDRYDCRGSTPVFPGCDTARAAFDACLAQGRGANACGGLAARTARCGPPPDPSAPPAPCGAAEVCAARCYLDATRDACAPTPLELQAAARCSAQCPP